ncbi:asialoglycoprotein receptor 1 [Malaclemys terrapin pileata]|uniref:asialoglycoprotein receptor 1 n=1 Tax=Malaclemys terrapin pileata TaxID=2991368 RepID=UPI0023A90634|nr:asialoglycoprotein receptor 1 [Malaclemys terrapin pileata]
MGKDYDDFQSLEPDDGTCAPSGRAFPPRHWGWQRLCASPRPLQALLALCVGLSIGTIALAVSNSRLGAEQQGTRGALASVNQSLSAELEGMARSVHILQDKLTHVAGSLDKAKENSIQAQQQLEEQVGVLRDSLNSLNCDLIELKSNGSRAGCCPRGWLRFGDSCYWFSGKQKTWEESNLYCKAQNSHLVVINTQDEQLYMQQETVPLYTWIGLSNKSGRWQWVDGSVYTMDTREWRAGQPDESDGHGLGGGEDCVYLHDDGLWNNAQCSRRYRWVCEEELKG